MTRPSIAGGVSFDLAALDGGLRKETADEASDIPHARSFANRICASYSS
jgi:hypothetical protein